MIARRIDFSTATALAFIATSIAPMNPPNRKSAIAPVVIFGASVSARRIGTTQAAVARDTTREPMLGDLRPGNRHQCQ